MLNNAEYLHLSNSCNMFSESNSNFVDEQQQLQHGTSAEQLTKMARDYGPANKLMQKKLQSDAELRQRIVCLLASPRSSDRDRSLLQLANDSNGNFVLQKLIECNSDNSEVYRWVEEHANRMAFSKYSGRVVQKLVNHLPPDRVRCLLQHNFCGSEALLVTDQNGNHIVQRAVERFAPSVYGKFVRSLAASGSELRSVMENKYGCRVLQYIMECLAHFIPHSRDEGEIRIAYDLLRVLLLPILTDAYDLAENEYANYLVQFVLKCDFLCRQRRYIIKQHFVHNLFMLSQGKYSSHVLEQAFTYADAQCLDAMYLEIFDGYQKDSLGRDALQLMLFNQFGNYVVQKMMEIAIQVRFGHRTGDHAWFGRIADCVLQHQKELARFSSGKKILEALKLAMLSLGYFESDSFVQFPDVHSPSPRVF